MSKLGDIESAVIALIEAIQVDSNDLFAEVKGFSGTATREVVAGLRRELKPAAYVVYDGRGQSDRFGVPEEPNFSVFAIVESLRGGDEPRTGSALMEGGFGVLGELFDALGSSIILTDHRLSYRDERLIASDDKSVIFEQRYVVLKMAAMLVPLFDSSAICGSGSIVEVTVGEFKPEVSRFAFPGIDGEFEQRLGLQARVITWSGQLRATASSALNTTESNIESLISQSLPADIIDGQGRTFTDCVPTHFTRRGPRRKNPISGEVLQNFELSFVQPNP